MPAGGPYKAAIATAGREVTLDDLLMGDVWFCSGQSNMVFPLKSAIYDRNEMKEAQKFSDIRLLNMRPLAETEDTTWDTAVLRKINELEYFHGSWQRCDSSSAKEFSAVAYFFGKELQQQLQVPIGLIGLAVGGSPAESWIDRYTMEHNDYLLNELYDWRNSDFLMPWVRQRADVNLKSSTHPKQRHPYAPTYNFDAGVSRFTSFPVKGVIWYQGESNAHNVELYEQLLPAMVSSWRSRWGYEFPFFYVQLSSINRPSWTAFRLAQSRLLDVIPNSGMAVSSDLGHPSDVHPRRKKEVGERLARLALHDTYGKEEVVASGPIPASAVRKNGELVVSFENAHDGLKTSDGGALRGFRLRNAKGQDREAEATIRDGQVVIPLLRGEHPVAVQYGWEAFTRANLENNEGLPASTFRLEVIGGSDYEF